MSGLTFNSLSTHLNSHRGNTSIKGSAESGTGASAVTMLMRCVSSTRPTSELGQNPAPSPKAGGRSSEGVHRTGGAPRLKWTTQYSDLQWSFHPHFLPVPLSPLAVGPAIAPPDDSTRLHLPVECLASRSPSMTPRRSHGPGTIGPFLSLVHSMAVIEGQIWATPLLQMATTAVNPAIRHGVAGWVVARPQSSTCEP